MHGYASAGMTEPLMSKEPIGTEGELTPGPDDVNPYDNPELYEGFEADRREPELPAQPQFQGELPGLELNPSLDDLL